jgi:hypothetical protein
MGRFFGRFYKSTQAQNRTITPPSSSLGGVRLWKVRQ